jgi:hypothetical protein
MPEAAIGQDSGFLYPFIASDAKQPYNHFFCLKKSGLLVWRLRLNVIDGITNPGLRDYHAAALSISACLLK